MPDFRDFKSDFAQAARSTRQWEAVFLPEMQRSIGVASVMLGDFMRSQEKEGWERTFHLFAFALVHPETGEQIFGLTAEDRDIIAAIHPRDAEVITGAINRMLGTDDAEGEGGKAPTETTNSSSSSAPATAVLLAS